MTTKNISSSLMKGSSKLRIASLLPSTTDICISLGLEDKIVGITHECDFPSSSHPLYSSSAPLLIRDGNGDGIEKDGDTENQPHPQTPPPLTLTVSQIDPHIQSQAEIDAAVKSSLHNGISLYNLNDTALTDSQPTIILTQSLCDVCAVATDAVNNEVACNFRPGQCRVLSLEPETLVDVVDTFVTVAEACGVEERGVEMKKMFWEGVQQVADATSLSKKDNGKGEGKKKPTVLFFEWMDPPFDAGHWIPDMLEQSGCDSALPWSKNTCKSIQLTWERIYKCDPDVVIIGCCGFDLKRNVEDARAARKLLEPLKAFRNKKIYASDGNLYFARPGPALREGIAILARCAYDGEEEVARALDGIDFMPEEGSGWSKITFPEESEEPSASSKITDIEDIAMQYAKLHEEACEAKLDFYHDPSTGYAVYTAHAHKKRGKCCGSGCRHCPYNHANVRDKARYIQQPAFLHEGSEDDEDDDAGEDAIFASISSIPSESHVKVLFFSGGKDSYLAIRALAKERLISPNPFHLVLLTTFDTESRVIAHQEVPIDTVVRQAQHLGLPLLGIPLRRGSGETYVSRIESGLDAIRKRVPAIRRMTLAFGDLHLDHIREWRDKELCAYELEYPLWKVPYEDLMKDFEASGISARLSAVTVEGGLKEGMLFTRELYNEAIELGFDGFGEEGEFHSVAEVWTVSRKRALGL